MPIEYMLLKDASVPLDACPKCSATPFYPFMRGQVQSAWRRFFRKPYCCLICWNCKEIVGYENPRAHKYLSAK
jgi:hypothetical protein